MTLTATVGVAQEHRGRVTSPVTDSTRTALASLQASAAAYLAGAGLLGLGAAWLTWRVQGLAPAYLIQVAASLALTAALVCRALPAHLPRRRFGAANGVTLLRAALTAWLVGYIGYPHGLAAAGWWVPGCGGLLLALDGVDGRLARRSGMASPFGARFDMEVDAALILVLAALLYQQGRAGAWILAAGLLRYVFIAAAAVLPWMRRELPPRRRRQAACVAQTAALVAALAPGLAPAWSVLLSGLGLGALVLSFAADTVWLYRRRGEG